MFNLIRAIPYLAIAGAIAGAAHWWIIKEKDNRIAGLEQQLKNSNAAKVALELANQEQKLKLEQVTRDAEIQRLAVSELSERNTQLVEERDDYVSIFRRHDLTNLSRVKPGLIEPRINKGTEEVFDTIEEDTQKIENTDSFSNFIYDDLP